MPKPGRARPAAPAQKILDLEIEFLGSGGDGIARVEASTLAIPRSLPGELVQAETGGSVGRQARGRAISILRGSPERVAAPCPHFDDLCGGCALQHLSDPAYADWKRGLVVQALERAGFADPAVAPLVRTSRHSRRRMDLAVRRRPGGVVLGLHRTHESSIVDFSQCLVMRPALFALVAPLRSVLSSLSALRHEGSVIGNFLADGPDLLLRTDGPLTPGDRAKLAAFAAAEGVPRVAWALGAGPSETAAQNFAPHVFFAGHRVEPPPGAFLQASAEGEAAIVAAVLAALPDRLTGKSRGIDLFAGCGTLSFPLAEFLRVLAFEGDEAAAGAVRRAQAGSRVEMTRRDLARQPLSAKEFLGASMIVLDPPYAGAAPQMPAIAASGVSRVVYVSCNPVALAKDARFLAKDYRLLGATPIDQFVWSAQVESVCVFERKSKP